MAATYLLGRDSEDVLGQGADDLLGPPAVSHLYEDTGSGMDAEGHHGSWIAVVYRIL